MLAERSYLKHECPGAGDLDCYGSIALTILINKEAAAERLVIAAVQMCERGDEPLAIHVVAMSALSVLRELIARRGDSFGTRSLGATIYYAATQKLAGHEYPKSLDEDFNSVLHDAADVVAAAISAGQVSHPDELDLYLPKHVEQTFYSLITAPFNYLKHADRDGEQLLATDDVDPTLATVNAIAALNMLFPGRELRPELSSFFIANTPSL